MRYFKFPCILIMLHVTAGCSKDKVYTESSSLTIVNAVVGSNPLVTNFSDKYELGNYYVNAQQITYGSYSTNNEFGSYNGLTSVSLFQYPDTTSKSKPLYNLSLKLSSGNIYTLFLTGLIDSPDTIFTTDFLPYHSEMDSTVGIRFVNLSPGSSSISVNLKGMSNASEVKDLHYRELTGFKNYSTFASISNYVFEFRDAGSGTLLGSFTMSGINNGIAGNNSSNLYRFHNITLVLKGIPGGTGNKAQGVFLVNNY